MVMAGSIGTGGEWTYYGWEAEIQYNRVHQPSGRMTLFSEGRFDFDTPDQTFNGAMGASGVDTTTVKFNLYNDGILVASTAFNHYE